MGEANHPDPPPTVFFEAVGMRADPWQEAFLSCAGHRLLVNGSRQAGKTTVAAALALSELLRNPGCLVLVLAPAERQAAELFGRLLVFYNAVHQPGLKDRGRNALELVTRSRILCLPGRLETLHGFPKARLLIIDEAARVPDELYRAVRPFLDVADGRLVLLSTPCGRRGFFHEAWHDKRTPWTRFTVPASQVPRLSERLPADALGTLGPGWYAQEYRCEFASPPGIVFPDFVTALSTLPAPPSGRRVGGIKFGFRTPFAALWGVYDRGELWIDEEYYRAGRPLRLHLTHLPRGPWYVADPRGVAELALMRRARFHVARGFHSVAIGLRLIQGRLTNHTLHVNPERCPNLCREAGLCCYPDLAEAEPAPETPRDHDNHALSALCYLVSRLDALAFRRALVQRDPPKPLPTSPTPDEAPHGQGPFARLCV